MAAPFSRTARSLANDGARSAQVAWALAALCLAGWAAWMLLGRITVYEVSRQARLEVASAPHALVNDIAGQLARTQLVIGRQVQAGEVLVELDSSAARLKLQEEEARANAIAPRQAALRAEIAALQAALAADQKAAAAALQSAQARLAEGAASVDFALDNARRLRGETAAGGVAEIDALRAEADARRLGAARDALGADQRRQSLDALTRVRQGQVQIEGLQRVIVTLDGDLATSQATQARLAQEIERHRVRAPVAGSIGEVQPLRPGAHVAEGQKLATIVPPGEQMLVVADFHPGSALGRLHPGQTARLKLDGFPWAQYGSVDARVLRVAGEIRDSLLRVDLQGSAPSTLPLQHGLAGVVEVAVEEVSPATLLLRAAGRAMGDQR